MTEEPISQRDSERSNRPFGVHKRSLTARTAAIAITAVIAASAVYAADAAKMNSPVPVAAITANDRGQQPLPSFADLVERVKPAVVSVYVKSEQKNDVSELMGQEAPNQFPQDSPFEFFFRQFGQPQQGAPNIQIQPAPQVARAQGSGFFISGDGYVLTNNHVVDHAKTVEIMTTDGKRYSAKVAGVDPKTDLALLKVDGSTDFPYVKFASSSPRIGDWVLAMGNPFGLGGTVTAGIVSANGRDIGAGPYDDFIQIDAPVNSGNSGGPTFNLKGEVVGVNTAIFTPSGGSVGIAFDIPAETAKFVSDQLEKTGNVVRGWIGVTIQPVTADIADSLGLKEAKGALVDEPQEGSSAAKAGIKSQDVIISVDGKSITDGRDLARTIAAVTPGQSISILLVRNGEQRTIDLKVRPFPEQKAAENVQPGESEFEARHDAGSGSRRCRSRLARRRGLKGRPQRSGCRAGHSTGRCHPRNRRQSRFKPERCQKRPA